MPMPRDVQSGHAPRVTGALELVWGDRADAAVADAASRVLAAFAPGVVQIDLPAGTPEVPGFAVDESYALARTERGWHLTASTRWGALHGLSTLHQLCAQGETTVAAVHDAPRFAWRGLLIDVARHYLPLDTLRDVLDGMARLKLNVLHLHLSDDQAFRFCSVAFPELGDAQAYTPDELRALVAHAAVRGIRVVPELDVPGHVHSWLLARPDWGTPVDAPTRRFGVHKAALDPCSDNVLEALDTLFGELCDVFPDAYLHIGGDEVHPLAWQDHAGVAELMAREGLNDFAAVQNWFNHRIVALLAARGRTAIGWDEVLHEDMPGMLVQNWRGATTRDRARRLAQPCIVSAPWYLDLMYPADLHYAFDPAAPQEELLALEDAQREDRRLKHVAEGIAWTDQWRKGALAPVPGTDGILGGEACLWGELVDAPVLGLRLWSRLPAVAERLWSTPERCEIASFRQRCALLFRQPPFDLHAQQATALSALGLDPAQVAFAAWLEPVKWYARLLGETALAARLTGSEMPQARPYQTDTPLNRIVDFLLPESLPTLALAGTGFDQWQAAAQSWSLLDAQAWPADARPVVQAAVEFAALVAQAKAFEDLSLNRDRIEALYEPHGEYMLAPAGALLDRIP